MLYSVGNPDMVSVGLSMESRVFVTWSRPAAADDEDEVDHSRGCVHLRSLRVFNVKKTIEAGDHTLQ